MLSVPRYLDGRVDCLLPHSPDYFALHCLPLQFDSAATCPTWDRFRDEVFEGDEERIACLHEWLDHKLMSDTKYQKFRHFSNKRACVGVSGDQAA